MKKLLIIALTTLTTLSCSAGDAYWAKQQREHDRRAEERERREAQNEREAQEEYRQYQQRKQYRGY